MEQEPRHDPPLLDPVLLTEVVMPATIAQEQPPQEKKKRQGRKKAQPQTITTATTTLPPHSHPEVDGGFQQQQQQQDEYPPPMTSVMTAPTAAQPLDDQSRLEKSREASQQFRDRQRERQETLERKAEALGRVNDATKQQIEAVMVENVAVGEQLAFLRSFIASAVAYEMPGGAGSSQTQQQGPEEIRSHQQGFLDHFFGKPQTIRPPPPPSPPYNGPL